jgi:hypothetical protein
MAWIILRSSGSISSAFVDFGQHAQLVQQPPVIEGAHNHPDAARQGQFVGHNPLARRRNIVASGCAQLAEGGDDRFVVLFLKLAHGARNVVRGHDLAARRIHLENDGADGAIVGRHFEFVGDQVRHVAAMMAYSHVADDSVDVDDGDLVVRTVILHHHLFKPPGALAPSAGPEGPIDRVPRPIEP